MNSSRASTNRLMLLTASSGKPSPPRVRSTSSRAPLAAVCIRGASQIQLLAACLDLGVSVRHLAPDLIEREAAPGDRFIAFGTPFFLNRCVAKAKVLQRPDGVDVEIASARSDKGEARESAFSAEFARTIADRENREERAGVLLFQPEIGGGDIGGAGRRLGPRIQGDLNQFFHGIGRVDQLHGFERGSGRRETDRRIEVQRSCQIGRRHGDGFLGTLFSGM